MTTETISPEDLFDRIGLGQYHEPGSLRCARVFEGTAGLHDAIRGEVEEVVSSLPSSEVGRPGHVTRWTKPYGKVRQWSLLNRTGATDSTRDDHDGRRQGKRSTLDPARFPALTAFLGLWPDATNMRLNVLDAASGLSPHEEPVVRPQPDGSVIYRTRFHYPVITSPEAVVLLDDEEHVLGAGDVWYFNNGCVHAARNDSDRYRAHLVWDQWLTERCWSMMFGPDRPDVALELTPRFDEPAPIRSIRVEEFERQRDPSLTLEAWRSRTSRFADPT